MPDCVQINLSDYLTLIQLKKERIRISVVDKRTSVFIKFVILTLFSTLVIKNSEKQFLVIKHCDKCIIYRGRIPRLRKTSADSFPWGDVFLPPSCSCQSANLVELFASTFPRNSESYSAYLKLCGSWFCSYDIQHYCSLEGEKTTYVKQLG